MFCRRSAALSLQPNDVEQLSCFRMDSGCSPKPKNGLFRLRLLEELLSPISVGGEDPEVAVTEGGSILHRL